MMQDVFRIIDKISPRQVVYAHCDIPCGIYDPHAAQMGAHTVLRMTKLIEEMSNEDLPAQAGMSDESKKAQLVRMVKVKEEHAELVKHEVTIIWGDYFKEENSKDIPDLHVKVWNILKLASKAKQSVDEKVAQDLLASVQEFAEIFWKSKGVEPVRIPSGYPTEGEVVSHK
ncbi:superoxide dismutase, Ni [Candidatus Microgenomates bacterium]|nr:superoxide dismutase, Ni [Candidatus Microgenomates bacterium]